MHSLLKIIFCLSLTTFVAACGSSGTGGDSGAALSAEERVKAAQDSVGVEGMQTNWKCVGQLDENGQRFIAVASQYDFQKGTMISVNRMTFAEASASRVNEALLFQHVSSYRGKTESVISVADPVTIPAYPHGTKLFTYDRADESLTFHQDLGGEKINKVHCKDRKVEKK